MVYTYNREDALSNKALNPKKKMEPVKSPFPSSDSPSSKDSSKKKKKSSEELNYTPMDQNYTPMSTPAPAQPAQASMLNYTPMQQEQAKKTGGLQNVADVGKILVDKLNPYSEFLPESGNINVNTDRSVLKRVTESALNNPYESAILASGVAGLVRGAVSAVSAVTAKSAVSNVGKVGTTGLYDYVVTEGKDVGTIVTRNFATNEFTKEVTKSWLTKLAAGLKNPALVSAYIVGAIGSYPWSGHLNADNLIGTYQIVARDAIEAGDLQSAALAQQELDEVLNPDFWDKLINAIPYLNVANSVKNIYEAAEISNSIYKKINADKIKQIQNGETEDQKWERINQERADEEKALIDYYNSERKKMIEWQREAEINARLEDAAFWAKEAARQRELEEKDREAIADFWEAYRKQAQKYTEDTRPSKLNFGLLG